MTDFIARYEQQLRALRRPRQQRARRRRMLFALVAAVAISAPAMAATQPWKPLLGDDQRGYATESTAPPPKKQIARLAVLRRPQTAADRGADVERALRFLGPGFKGVHTTSTRLLRDAGPGAGAVLIPVEAVENRYPDGRAATTPDGLCLSFPDPNGDGVGQTCVGLDVLLDQLPFELGRTLYGLMPDGIATVRITMFKGPGVTAPVEDNFYAVRTEKPARGGPVQLEALDASGSVVKTVRRSDWEG